METHVRGDLSLTHLDSDAPFFTEKVFGLPVQSEEQLLSVPFPDLDNDYGQHHSPIRPIQPVYIQGDSPVILVTYKDQLKKPYPLSKAYEVCVMIAYVEKHPDIEAIQDSNERTKLYDRAIRAAISGFAG